MVDLVLKKEAHLTGELEVSAELTIKDDPGRHEITTYELPPIEIPTDRASQITHEMGDGVIIKIFVTPKPR